MTTAVVSAPDAVLKSGLTALGLVLSEAQQVQLLEYLGLIQKWNQVYNLTALRDPADMLTHHLLDSLAVITPLRRQLQTLKVDGQAPPQQNARLLDVGSGAGLPGVVIAICCPDIRVSCVDTVAKKARFIQQAAIALKLPNLQGVHARVENLKGPFDVVCSRAFASLVDFTTWSSGALVQQTPSQGGGIWMALKGRHPAEEIIALTASSPDVEVFHVEQLTVPGLDAERCIVWLRKKTASDAFA